MYSLSEDKIFRIILSIKELNKYLPDSISPSKGIAGNSEILLKTSLIYWFSGTRFPPVKTDIQNKQFVYKLQDCT